MIYLPVALILLWVLFLSYAILKLHWNALRPEVKAVGVIVVICGLIVDVAINWTLGLALGVTKDFTLSQKCKRLGHGVDWRASIARYLCQNWLNPFDKDHC